MKYMIFPGKQTQIPFVGFFYILVSILNFAYAADVMETYKIQPGDVLEVSVWQEENLQKQVLVRPDGGMSFPLAGDMQAAGKSVTEVQKLITERLTKYIPDPVVTVSTLKLDGNKVYVIGKVARPGESSRPTVIWMSCRR